MHKPLLVFLTLCFTNLLFPSNSEIINKNSKVQAYHVNGEITLDGVLDEQVWKNQAIENLYQRNPDEGKPATQKSKIWIAYDEDAIYVSAKLFDTSPDSIISQMARRDQLSEADLFAVAFDSYNDNRTAFFFGVEPSGSFTDGIFFNDDWDDNSWNGVWDFAVKIDTDGWNVEMKIPFSQLRFNQSEEMVWGVNFYRNIQRRNEEDYFVMVPKNESGFVSHFADLIGLNGIKPKPRFELLPYVVSKAQYLIHDSNDPFYKSKQYKLAGGLDSKIGLGSNITIDATINPDFGQVEVDPAVINLSAFETYYEEKRPFFIEGNEIFYFGRGGANNNWSFNWSNPELFYSRRIGRLPQGSVEYDGFVNYPTETRILGAAKLTGKVGESWSIGFINALTERTFAQIDSSGVRFEQEVEPLTYYGIFRTKNEFNSDMHSIGFMSTVAIRDLREPNLKNILSDKSFVFGTDGWSFLDSDKTYVLTGYFAGSYSHGTKDYLIKLQKEPQRYMQRPDATYATLDSNLTSLSGWIGRIVLNKQKGNFYINSAIGAVSPGFNINDLGFQFRADAINGHLVTGYRWFEPDDLFRRKQIYLAYFRNYDFEGNLSNAGYFLFANAQFLNYYGFNINTGYGNEAYSKFLTRGGPLTKSPSNFFVNFSTYSDSRKNIVIDLSGNYSRDKLGSNSFSLGTEIEWKPNSQINFKIAPFLTREKEILQWVGKFEDEFAVPTYGIRYVYATLKQTVLSTDIRLNWTFTPRLSLQLYLQPFFAVGSYSDFKELKKPKTYDYLLYGNDNSSIYYNEKEDSYEVDPDGIGPSEKFSFTNPNFNFKSIRGNLVLRWEFLPGSTAYLVWTHNRVNFDNPGNFSLKRDFKDLMSTDSDNIFMIKVSYWFNAF